MTVLAAIPRLVLLLAFSLYGAIAAASLERIAPREFSHHAGTRRDVCHLRVPDGASRFLLVGMDSTAAAQSHLTVLHTSPI